MTAQSYGFTTPTGSDLIRDGDEAISNNATKTAAALAALEARVIPKPKPPTGTDLNTLDVGTYQWSSSSGTYPNKPPGGTGVLVVTDAGNTTFQLRQQMWYATTGNGVWYRSVSSNGVWSAWARLDLLPGDVSPAVVRDILITDYRRRRGGTIGTGGLPAVALRFDHGLTKFNSIVLPLLRQHGLPWAQAITTDRVGSGEDAMTWAQLQAAAIDSGGEIANHSKTHGNPNSNLALAREVIDSLAALKTNLPRLPIELWMPPGQPEGEWFGYMSPNAAAKYDTYAGRLILANHALTFGYMPPGGYYRPLTGQLIQGMPHYTGDIATLAQLQGRVNGIPSGHGLTIMFHPALVDTTGNITAANLGAFLSWLAAERDAGRLVVLTPGGLAIADHTRPPVVHGPTLEVQRTGTAGATYIARSTGAGTLTVTDQTGTTLATKTNATSGPLWLPVTVPLDATSITATVTGTLTPPTLTNA